MDTESWSIAEVELAAVLSQLH
jgi:hypothetical protein